MPTYQIDAIEDAANLAADEAAELATLTGQDVDAARRIAYDRVWADLSASYAAEGAA